MYPSLAKKKQLVKRATVRSLYIRQCSVLVVVHPSSHASPLRSRPGRRLTACKPYDQCGAPICGPSLVTRQLLSALRTDDVWKQCTKKKEHCQQQRTMASRSTYRLFSSARRYASSFAADAGQAEFGAHSRQQASGIDGRSALKKWGTRLGTCWMGFEYHWLTGEISYRCRSAHDLRHWSNLSSTPHCHPFPSLDSSCPEKGQQGRQACHGLCRDRTSRS